MFVDGKRISANKPIQVFHHSTLRIGPSEFVVDAPANLGPTAAPPLPPSLPPSSSPLDTPALTQVRASHILVKHRESRRPSSWKERNVTRSKEEALAIIQQFREQIVSGQVDFASLASTESHCSSCRAGGDLGMFGRGAMQPSFEAAAFALAVGELSQPVFSDSGVHLILRTV